MIGVTEKIEVAEDEEIKVESHKPKVGQIMEFENN